MSKVQPNHERRIMQTGLGQPESLCAGNTRWRGQGARWRRFGGIWGVGWGKRSKKLATLWELLLSGCVDICIRDTYINITVGRKGGLPRCEEVTAKKRIFGTEVRENFARNTHVLLVSLGSWFRGFAKWTRHTHLKSFSGWEESALPGVLGWGRKGGRGTVNLEYGLPDFQEGKAVSICLGTWG